MVGTPFMCIHRHPIQVLVQNSLNKTLIKDEHLPLGAPRFTHSPSGRVPTWLPFPLSVTETRLTRPIHELRGCPLGLLPSTSNKINPSLPPSRTLFRYSMYASLPFTRLRSTHVLEQPHITFSLPAKPILDSTFHPLPLLHSSPFPPSSRGLLWSFLPHTAPRRHTWNYNNPQSYIDEMEARYIVIQRE